MEVGVFSNDDLDSFVRLFIRDQEEVRPISLWKEAMKHSSFLIGQYLSNYILRRYSLQFQRQFWVVVKEGLPSIRFFLECSFQSMRMSAMWEIPESLADLFLVSYGLTRGFIASEDLIVWHDTRRAFLILTCGGEVIDSIGGEVAKYDSFLEKISLLQIEPSVIGFYKQETISLELCTYLAKYDNCDFSQIDQVFGSEVEHDLLYLSDLRLRPLFRWRLSKPIPDEYRNRLLLTPIVNHRYKDMAYLVEEDLLTPVIPILRLEEGYRDRLWNTALELHNKTVLAFLKKHNLLPSRIYQDYMRSVRIDV
jgi:hypothetical protein